MARKLRILALEPYYGGSHRAFLDTLVQHSRHRFTVMTLPARKWKWRMRGAAIWFAQKLVQTPPEHVDAILTSDMTSVADLKSLLAGGLRDVPLICYFHENQLTYPLPDESDRDFQYGFTNITSCLASEAVWFNSRFHLHGFLEAAASLLRKMPDYVPEGIIESIRRKAAIMYPLVDCGSAHANRDQHGISRPVHTVRILWSHRWEYDKNPESFFKTMIRLNESGYDFRLVIVGERFRETPRVFAESWARLAPKIEHAGYVKSRSDYLSMLAACDLIVSTAIQENFGIAVAEAMACGCRPLLPDRLSYPELIPERFHRECLYRDDKELYEKLARLIENKDNLYLHAVRASIMEWFSAERNIEMFDTTFERLVEAT